MRPLTARCSKVLNVEAFRIRCRRHRYLARAQMPYSNFATLH